MEKGARSQRWGCGLGRGPAASNRGACCWLLHSFSRLSRKLISNCSSSFLRAQGIAGREGGVPGEAARLPRKDPDAIWEAEESPLTSTSAPSKLPSFPIKPGRWERGKIP